MRLLIIAFCAAVSGAAAADTYVQGYIRKDGTYVPPHHRSSPDGSKWNNYATQGNTNPYTGKAGTADPYGSSNNYGNSLYGRTKKW